MSNWAAYEEMITDRPVVKRAKHALHFRRPGGLVEAHFTGVPCHYLENGLWLPIDTRLIALPDGSFSAPHSDIRIHKDGRVRAGEYLQFTDIPGAKAGRVDGDKVVRAFPGGEQWMILKENGFREEIHLEKRGGIPAVKFLSQKTGKMPSHYQARELLAEDAKGRLFVFSGNEQVFADWLDQAVFPVVIDPDFAAGTADKFVYGLNATYATARSTSSASDNSSNYIRIGQVLSGAGGNYGCYRGFEVFDTSSIEDAATVQQNNLKAVCITDFSSVADFDVQIIKQDWSSGTDEQLYDNCLAGIADDAIWRNTSGMSLNTQYTSGNLSTAWVNKTGNTYYSFRSSRDLAGTSPGTGGFLAEYIYLASQNHATASYRPVLAVVYGSAGNPWYYFAQLR